MKYKKKFIWFYDTCFVARSDDGKYLVYADWENEKVVVREATDESLKELVKMYAKWFEPEEKLEDVIIKEDEVCLVLRNTKTGKVEIRCYNDEL